MALDPYALCPCGSGKKLKFCCKDIAEDMLEVERLQSQHEAKLALKELERIEPRQPHSPWLLRIKALLLQELGRGEEALQVLETLLSAVPDHPVGLFLNASLRMGMLGLEHAQAAIQRGFEVGAEVFPEGFSHLARNVGMELLQRKHYLAARRFFELGAYLASASGNQDLMKEVVERLVTFDSLQDIPYPLRSSYAWKPLGFSADAELTQAHQFSHRAQWDSAVGVFRKLTEQHRDSAPAWYNLGLCYAWASDERSAVTAFRKAAELEPDFDAAVDAEVLAQLLEYEFDENTLGHQQFGYPLNSMSRVLTLLDQQERFVRQPVNEAGQLASYVALDRPLPPGPTKVDLAQVPRIVSIIVVLQGETPDAPTALFWQDRNSELGADLRMQFAELCGADAELLETVDAEREPLLVPHLADGLFIAPETPPQQRLALTRAQFEHALNESWPNLRLPGLRGKTPQEAVGVEELRVPLAGALLVLDAYYAMYDQVVPLEKLRSRLKLPEPETLHIGENEPPALRSTLELRRAALYELNDEQLGSVLRRAVASRHLGFVYDALTEAAARNADIGGFARIEIYRNLASICRSRDSKQEALAWCARGREYSQGVAPNFETQVMWDLFELSLRVDDRQDPLLAPLLQHVWFDLARKLPQIREQLTPLLTTYGIPIPGTAVVPGAELAGSVSPQSGLWTPGAAPAPAGAASKLWLPGRD